MFGAPDDISCISQNTYSDMMPTISDSDLVRDAKQVHWHPLPFIPDTATTSVHSHSKDTLIGPDSGSSTKSGRGLRNFKAKIRAVARFLSSPSKGRGDSMVAAAVSAKGFPIAGQNVQSGDVPAPESNLFNGYGEMRAQRPESAPNFGVQVDVGQQECLPAIETLRERLDTQQEWVNRPPPPPQPPQQLFRSDSPVKPPSNAILAKKRHPNGPEIGIGLVRPEPPRTRSGTPHPALVVAPQQLLPPAVRVVSRPLPPTPALPSLSHQDDRSIQHKLGGSGLTNLHNSPTQPPVGRGNVTHVDAAPAQLERLPSRRRPQQLLDANRLAEELESLVSTTTRKPKSIFSSASTSTRIADSSMEAVCHWRPQEEDHSALLTPLPSKPSQTIARKHGRPKESTKSSLHVETSEESEAVHRIQKWRVHIKHAPSMVSSKVASAHSGFDAEEKDDDDGISSHLTSVSRSPLSKGSAGREDAEVDPDKTPTLRARRVNRLGVEPAQAYKASPSSKGSKKSPSAPSQTARASKKVDDVISVHLGTNHIARLSDSQFDRLARATEGPSPPLPTTIPREELYLHPNPDDERRSSFENPPPTTLSVLERRAVPHIDTLDQMIRRHPDKMYEVFRKRPGLMLVVLLRCKVEDRLSQVDVSTQAAMDPAPASSGVGFKQKQDCISLLEESLIDLHFDNDEEEEQEVLQPIPLQGLEELESFEPEYPPTAMPSIIVSQHHTGSNAASLARSKTADTSSSKSHATSHIGMNEKARVVGAAMVGEIAPRTEAALQEMVSRLEQAGELCSVQQTLLSIQDKLMDTKADQSRLWGRLSALEQRLFSQDNTPNTSASFTLV
ncbi:uncharacterized protein UTRI_01106 [Ustilago trichophora]|uniref:Uncharacterized protein n=1 Tax=Ustilago trichophora TaxID=86804 RepID=A0A5C3DW38_9BASI|nr:uncharacterized protein UTRI_01106 [Ustilago trichophora]